MILYNMPITAKYLKDKKDKKEKKEKEKKEKEKKKRVKKEVVKQKQKQSQSVVVNVVAPVRRRSRPKPKLVVPQRPTFIQTFQPQPQFNVPTTNQLVPDGQRLGVRVREAPAPMDVATPVAIATRLPFADELLTKSELARRARRAERYEEPFKKKPKPVKATPVKAVPKPLKQKLILKEPPFKAKPVPMEEEYMEPFMEMGGRGVGRPSLNRTPEEKKLAAKEAKKKFNDKKKREKQEAEIREATNMIERRNLIQEEAITDINDFMG